ncbi:hypothetical protein [Streptomyces sp. CA-179760]|uniref:hypothetical protein n=1 Tax=Streptomyces sp. CA-179760 TaxID=3240054 RepID=UPI003D8C6822
MRLTRPAEHEAVDLTKVDLVAPAVHGEGDPHAIWHAMREREPVHWQQVDERLGYWSATTYDDVAKVLKDHRVFTSEHGTLLNLLGKKDPASRKQLPATDPLGTRRCVPRCSARSTARSSKGTARRSAPRPSACSTAYRKVNPSTSPRSSGHCRWLSPER